MDEVLLSKQALVSFILLYLQYKTYLTVKQTKEI